jgi:hypothetical protein
MTLKSKSVSPEPPECPKRPSLSSDLPKQAGDTSLLEAIAPPPPPVSKCASIFRDSAGRFLPGFWTPVSLEMRNQAAAEDHYSTSHHRAVGKCRICAYSCGLAKKNLSRLNLSFSVKTCHRVSRAPHRCTALYLEELKTALSCACSTFSTQVLAITDSNLRFSRATWTRCPTLYLGFEKKFGQNVDCPVRLHREIGTIQCVANGLISTLAARHQNIPSTISTLLQHVQHNNFQLLFRKCLNINAAAPALTKAWDLVGTHRCSLSWFAFLQASAGEPIPELCAVRAGPGWGERRLWIIEPPARSLSGPSPSANLAGIWKGDPLPRRLAGTTISRLKMRCAFARPKADAGAQPHRRRLCCG